MKKNYRKVFHFVRILKNKIFFYKQWNEFLIKNENKSIKRRKTKHFSFKLKILKFYSSQLFPKVKRKITT